MQNETPEKRDEVKLALDLTESLGGEQLEGSGFEDEVPEPISEWRDPR